MVEEPPARVSAAVSGEGQFSNLTSEERVAAHALVDAHIAELAASQSFGPAARAERQTTVAAGDGGELVEIAPDGTPRTW